jgi:hypothetical protein
MHLAKYCCHWHNSMTHEVHSMRVARRFLIVSYITREHIMHSPFTYACGAQQPTVAVANAMALAEHTLVFLSGSY